MLKIIGMVKYIRNFKNLSFIDIFSNQKLYQISIESSFVNFKIQKNMYLVVWGTKYRNKIGKDVIKVKKIKILSAPSETNYTISSLKLDKIFNQINFIANIEKFLIKKQFFNLKNNSINNVIKHIFFGLHKLYFIENIDDEYYLNLYVVENSILNIFNILKQFFKKTKIFDIPLTKLNFIDVMNNYLKTNTEYKLNELKAYCIKFELLIKELIIKSKTKDELLLKIFEKNILNKLIGLTAFINFPNKKNLNTNIFLNNFNFINIKKLNLNNYNNGFLNQKMFYKINIPSFYKIRINLLEILI